MSKGVNDGDLPFIGSVLNGFLIERVHLFYHLADLVDLVLYQAVYVYCVYFITVMLGINTCILYY